jgi:carboxyl-terminal processing protease
MKKNHLRGIKIASIVATISLVGLAAGFLTTQKVLAVHQSRFEKLELFNKVLYLIESQYYRDVDTSKLIQGAIKGMLSTLDPHSSFLDDEVFGRMQEETQGEFGGVGIEVTIKDGTIIITTPLEDTPAFRAGVKSGDRIVEIDHEVTAGMTLDQAIDKMKGKVGTKLTIGIARESSDSIKQFSIMREIIKINPVKAELLQHNYSFIRLTQFQKRSAEEIIEAIKKHQTASKAHGGLKGIILDLRSNPGGLLDEAVDVASIFLKDGIVVSTEGRDPKNKEIRYVKKAGFKETQLPLSVLVNGSSASASEIVAGALQDNKRGIIMGNLTFGKGSVQSVVKIDDEKGLKITIAQYMTPSGRKIQALGIKPDIEIDDVEGDWFSGIRSQEDYIREADLRNHLTATIETSDEKKLREETEKRDREERIKKVEVRKKNAAAIKKNKDNENDNETFKKYNPREDYQVVQAINYMKGINIIAPLKK